MPTTLGTASADVVSSALLNAYKITLEEVDSYLFSLDLRVRCEEDYVRALRGTLEKSRDQDVKLDARIGAMASNLPGASNLPSMRRAWKELQQDILQDIDVRVAFAETLRTSVIAPLRQYHDAQERIRRRVKDDLKGSLADYDEMRHVHLKRVKKTYDRSCEIVDSLKQQQQAAEEQRMLLSPPSRPRASRDGDSSDGGGFQSLAEEQAPSPRRSASFGRKKSTVLRHGHQGSPSASSSSPPEDVSAGDAMGKRAPGAFFESLKSKEGWENARKEAAKRTNALITKMREGGTHESADRSIYDVGGASPSLSGGDASGLQATSSLRHKHTHFAQSMAVKLSKAKREASEADKAYRRAIFDLETLALRRDKTIAAARASVLQSRRELFDICSQAWLTLVHSMQGRSNAESSLAHQAEQIVLNLRGREHLDDELAIIDARMPSLNTSPTSNDGPVRYVNHWHGEYQTLLFGVSLVDYDFARSQRGAPHLGPAPVDPPLIVSKCISYIEEHALDHPGIYRISAKHTAVQQLAADFERDEVRFTFDPSHDEPAAVAGVLKQWLRELPQPVMAMPWEERLKLTHSLDEQLANGFAALKSRIRRLPPIHQVTLRVIIEHLARIASHADTNKMTAKNLSVIFGPVLLSEGDRANHIAGPTILSSSNPGASGLAAVSGVLTGGNSNPVVASGATGGASTDMSLAAAMEEDNVCEILIEYCSDIFSLEKSGAPVVPWNLKSTGAPLSIDLERSTTCESRAASSEHAPILPPISTGSEDHTLVQGVPQRSSTALSSSSAYSTSSPTPSAPSAPLAPLSPQLARPVTPDSDKPLVPTGVARSDAGLKRTNAVSGSYVSTDNAGVATESVSRGFDDHTRASIRNSLPASAELATLPASQPNESPFPHSPPPAQAPVPAPLGLPPAKIDVENEGRVS